MKCLVLFIILISTQSCSVYLNASEQSQKRKDIEERRFKEGSNKLNESLSSKTIIYEICDFKLILELLAKTKVDYEKIEIDENAALLIKDFLVNGYNQLRKGQQIPSYTTDETAKKLEYFLRQLYKEGKKNNNKINNDVFKRLKDTFCPLYPWC